MDVLKDGPMDVLIDGPMDYLGTSAVKLEMATYFRLFPPKKYKIKISLRAKKKKKWILTKQRTLRNNRTTERFCTPSDENDARAMANEEDDLDLLLSLQDKVVETPPGTPPHASGTMVVLATMLINHFFVSSSSSSSSSFD